jgi:Family of unknown function (DUF5758)/Pentapeptide repeats (8 copies)
MLIKFLDGSTREIANLRDADLSYADLIGTNLRDADLRCASLLGANLRGANLRGANLSYANLRGANLRGANLRGANLSYATLRDADLRGAKGLEQFKVAPEIGAFIAFKKLQSGAIATLLIPADAARVNAYSSRKCRAEFVYVQQLDSPDVDKHTGKVPYVQGTRVCCDKFDPDPRIECSGGIHFFMTKEEALAY